LLIVVVEIFIGYSPPLAIRTFQGKAASTSGAVPEEEENIRFLPS
jgi:hypothetical protein